jgi:hypothetical protein
VLAPAVAADGNRDVTATGRCAAGADLHMDRIEADRASRPQRPMRKAAILPSISLPTG